jgi:diguanylate cyclase (GGDEF)-like protein
MDLDRFKTVNDNLGHQIGDNLLIQVTKRLQNICRKTDTLARLGGDEFTLIVEDVDKVEELSIIAEKILNMFLEPFELGNYKLDVSSSIGVSVFPQDSMDPGELIRHADTAMYSAKENGRNNFRFYTEELTSNAYEYFEIEIAMRSALQFDQFFLVYQPQFDLITNEIIGVEALIRWLHPKLGVISPARFIPVAETTGQIEQIGEWVITETARQTRTWDQAGLPPFTVSLNISRKQLIVPGLSWSVSQIIDDVGIDGSRFEFEITESSILDRQEIVYANLKELKSMGISLAIDDFGTGYSSLVNLKQFPLSRLKIDQSFVRDVTKDTNDEAIIRATIALGKSLQLAIIAEGVETEEQREFLIREGCEHAQGYLYSEPLLPEQIIELFQKVNRTMK